MTHLPNRGRALPVLVAVALALASLAAAGIVWNAERDRVDAGARRRRGPRGGRCAASST